MRTNKPVTNVEKYLLNIDSDFGDVYLVKSSGEVRITPQRALEWVEAGIKSFECRTKEQMIEALKALM